MEWKTEAEFTGSSWFWFVARQLRTERRRPPMIADFLTAGSRASSKFPGAGSLRRTQPAKKIDTGPGKTKLNYRSDKKTYRCCRLLQPIESYIGILLLARLLLVWMSLEC